MKRYSTTRQKIDKSGKRVYSTTYYPQIPISDSDKFIHPVSGDRLDTLAYKYYGDITLWWIIAKANGLKGKVGVSVGNILRIPGNITIILENFRKINRTG
jgi:nucleoid-associated protein YgaU